MIATARPTPLRADLPPRWGGSDAAIVTRLSRLENQLDRIEAALLGLTEREAERNGEDQAIEPPGRTSFTALELAEALGLKRHHINTACRDGRIKATKASGERLSPWIIDRAEYDRVLADGIPDHRDR